jgi:ATP synthase protein I
MKPVMSEDPSGDLGARIAKAQAARDAATGAADAKLKRSATKPAGMALRYSAELVASVLIGVGLGLLVDHFFPTRPFGLLVFMGLGIAAGFRNVLRAARKMTDEDQAAAPELPADNEKIDP